MCGQNRHPEKGLWGWRYRPQAGDNDISVTGWCVLALGAADSAGLATSRPSLHGALTYCEEVINRESGLVGYFKRPPEIFGIHRNIQKNDDYTKHPAALAAMGMCVRSIVKPKVHDTVFEKGAKLILNDLPEWNKVKKSIDYNYWFWATLALTDFDGPESGRVVHGNYWKSWVLPLKKALLDNQVYRSNLCAEGSWDGDDKWGIDGGGRVYATAINTLTLEIYYQYPDVIK
ncbi:MAG: hypothetical protein ACKVS6_12460 [Planctomycetota bacterium]